MADFFEQTRTDIEKRLRELKPLYEEYLKLERAKSALEGVDQPRRRPGRPRGPGTARRRGATRRRRRRGGTTAERALKKVRQSPGITVRELAEELRVKHKNYLYRVMAGLEDDGAVKKRGQGYVAR